MAKVISKSSPSAPQSNGESWQVWREGKCACVSARPVPPASFAVGFGVQRRDGASQADGDVCCCSGGCGESPVQAAPSSAGWEKSRGSSPRIKPRGEGGKKRKKKAHPLCFRAVVFPLLWVWESALCALLVMRGDI